ncbi:hypothetical protein [Bradyrhizobium sp. USDA 223]|uniref:hypothetical protein n=1 Tax=Bradyrhizobium sp. USDA 223 TaxID=3156306 RepID=UPI0038384E64
MQVLADGPQLAADPDEIAYRRMESPSDFREITMAGDADDKTNERPEVLQGLAPVDAKLLQEFLKEMDENVIPDIVKAVEKRRLRAAESRQWQLKC